METNELFFQVAQIAGWQNISKWNSDIRDNTYVGFTGNPDRIQASLFIPRYDQDLNAIVDLFGEAEILFDLKSYKDRTSDGCLERYSATYKYSIKTGIIFWGNTPAIAMCELFVAIIEQKKADGLLK